MRSMYVRSDRHSQRDEQMAKKPTRFLTNCPGVYETLHVQCAHPKGSHQVLIGGLAKQCEVYPKKLVQAFMRGLSSQLALDKRHRASLVASAADTEEKPLRLMALEVVKSWIYDSGSGRDLVSEMVAKAHYEHWVKAPPIRLATANGTTESRNALRCHILPFGESADVYILKSTPPVLSLGRRVMEDRHDFFWRHSFSPAIFHPTHGLIILKVKNFIPMLDVEHQRDMESKTLTEKMAMAGLEERNGKIVVKVRPQTSRRGVRTAEACVGTDAEMALPVQESERAR